MILFPAHPTLGLKHPDPGFIEEVEAAKQAGFPVRFVDIDTQKLDPRLSVVSPGEEALYRGWIIKPKAYESLNNALRDLSHGCSLYVRPEQYEYCYNFPNWYRDIGGLTPESFCLPGKEFNLDKVAETVEVEFEGAPLILKDYNKSRKHEWYDACYIGSSSDAPEVKRVVGNFLERQGDDLAGGLVFRKYVPLKYVGTHPKSGLKLANEHRYFVRDGIVFYKAPYWAGNQERTPYPFGVIRSVTARIESPFYAIDMAELEDSTWMVIEINEGCTAGVPEGGSIRDFYEALAQE
jgi:hypothetical protein